MRGMDHAGSLTDEIVARWKPTYVLVVGIAGGVHGRDDLCSIDVERDRSDDGVSSRKAGRPVDQHAREADPVRYDENHVLRAMG